MAAVHNGIRMPSFSGLNYKIDVHDLVKSVHEEGIIIKPGIPANIFLFEEQTAPDADFVPGVEYNMTNKFLKNMNLARLLNPGLPVLVHMSTNGGDWYNGMAIYDTIKKYPAQVTILDYRHSSSMSSIIFLAADKRVMAEDSHFMYHDGWMSSFNTWKGYEAEYEFLKKTFDVKMWDIYAEALMEQGKYKGLPKEEIIEILHNNRDKKQDVYLTAQEAVEWGFADEVFDGNWENLAKYTKEQRKRK